MLARILLLLGLLAPAARADEKKKVELFGRDRVWTMHLSFTEKEWEAMQPVGGGRMPFFGQPPQPPKDDKKEPPKDAKTSVFGMTFPYVRGAVEFEGKTWKNVGVRFKGNSTYMTTARGLKRPFKLDFNHYVKGQEFLGLTSLNLANDAFDASHLRQALAFQIFREIGLPSPRTAFVQLYLTIPGKHTKEYLYTIVEEVNKQFLRKHYDTSKGLLLKPERIQGLPYLGEEWKAYADKLQPKTEAQPEHTKRAIAFTKLIDRADDATFKKEIEQYMEVDQFLRYLAVNVALSNLDSFLGIGHNYYLYLHPKTNKINWIPWDVDLSFGNFLMGGDQIAMSIKEPYMGGNRLIERILAVKEYDKAYREHLRKLTQTTFSTKRISEEIDALKKVLAKALENEPKREAGGPMMGPWRAMELKPFVEKRLESLVAQLDGKAEGVKPGGFGFGGGGIGRPGRAMLELADANKDGKVSEEELAAAMKKLFKDGDKNKDGVLDERELAEVMQKLMPPPRPFGGPGGNPFGGPGGGGFPMPPGGGAAPRGGDR